MEQIRILVVDDERSVRRGLRMRLELEPDMVVAGEAGDGEAAVELACRLTPDVVLMDLEMPKMDGITAIRCLRELRPRCPVIVLTLYDDSVNRARASAAGARAFVPKHHVADRLIDVIRREAARGAAGAPAQI
jgi:DNA-binding NarL/FixJ family response regulator